MPSARRRFLATCAAATGALAGCASGLPLIDSDLPDGDYPEGIDETRWPSPGRDDARTAFAPDAAPVDDPAVRWRSEFTVPLAPAEPAVAAGHAFHPVDGVRAVDLGTGETDWRADAAPVGAPAVRDGVAYVPSVRTGDAAPALVGYDVESAEEAWRAELPGWPTSPPAFDQSLDRIVVGVGERVCGVDADAAAVDWTREVFGRVAAAPAVNLGVVAVLTEAGELYALGADGNALWRRSLDARTRRVPPVLGEERAYIAGGDGSVVAVGRRHGDRRWRTEVAGFLREPMALDGHLLYVPAPDGVAALNPNTGEERWRYDAADRRRCSAAAVDGAVYATSGTGDLLRVAPADGSVDWSLSLGRLVGYGMAAVDETVYAVAMPDDGPQRLVAVA
jgi:outer membrane protein assembly factor BamB